MVSEQPPGWKTEDKLPNLWEFRRAKSFYQNESNKIVTMGIFACWQLFI